MHGDDTQSEMSPAANTHSSRGSTPSQRAAISTPSLSESMKSAAKPWSSRRQRQQQSELRQFRTKWAIAKGNVMRMSQFIAFVALLFHSAAASSQQSQTGVIEGIVIQAGTTEPIAGAQVTLS